MMGLPNIVVELIAYELEDIYDYNALRATNSGVKQTIDRSALKRPFFFSTETKHWVGRYSQRVFLPNDDRCHVLVTHPMCATKNDMMLSKCISGLSLVDIVYWLTQHHDVWYNDMRCRRRRTGTSYKTAITTASVNAVCGELDEIFKELMRLG